MGRQKTSIFQNRLMSQETDLKVFISDSGGLILKANHTLKRQYSCGFLLPFAVYFLF
jgi:hypothetical protein